MLQVLLNCPPNDPGCGHAFVSRSDLGSGPKRISDVHLFGSRTLRHGFYIACIPSMSGVRHTRHAWVGCPSTARLRPHARVRVGESETVSGLTRDHFSFSDSLLQGERDYGYSTSSDHPPKAKDHTAPHAQAQPDAVNGRIGHQSPTTTARSAEKDGSSTQTEYGMEVSSHPPEADQA